MISKYSYDFLVDTNDLQYKNFSNFTFGNHDTGEFRQLLHRILKQRRIKRLNHFAKLQNPFHLIMHI